ncbi:MAG: hypothetical protein J6X44_09650 [Thermoguttaceae bacterium]|nr:hypothetical protein [Thermoguttaceae bacterium]
MTLEPTSQDSRYIIERPNNSLLVVRMISQPYQGRELPDAQFTFRIGEPQFDVWLSRYFEQEQRRMKSDV